MYSFDSRVRFSETDSNGQLSLPAVINYFQDCSEFQSHSLGTGVGTLGTHAWILNAWQVQFKRFPKRNEAITIGTKPYQFKGIEGLRNFLILDANGEVLINANSIWTYFDLQKQRPCRITDDQYEAYQLEDAYPMECAPRKITVKELSENNSFLIGEPVRTALPLGRCSKVSGKLQQTLVALGMAILFASPGVISLS